jgi:Ca-activated chloride channel family protein
LTLTKKPELNFEYQHPLAFYLLALVPFILLLFVLYKLWKRRVIRKVGDPQLVKSLMKEHSPAKANFKFILVLLAFALGCLAVANPRKRDEAQAESRKGIDLVIALDVSNSMLAADIAPNRLARARQFISRLIDNLKDDRIGLVLFAGNAYVQMPLTFDQNAAKMYVSTATPGSIPSQGTSISDALEKAGVAFGEDNERFCSIVLVTDGETHDEGALDKAKEMAGKGVMINTIGIGSAEGSTILDSSNKARVDEGGQVVVSKLNEDLLKQVALGTNGIYVNLQSAEAAVKEVLAQYAQIEKKALGDTSTFSYKSFYTWLAIPMLLFLLIEMLITDRKKVKA